MILSWAFKKHYVVRCLGGRPAARALTIGGAQELARQWEEAGHGPVTIETIYPEPPHNRGIRGQDK